MIVGCLLVAGAPGAQPATAPAPPSEAVVTQRVDEYMAAETRVNGFSGTILLARKGAAIVAKNYSQANAE